MIIKKFYGNSTDEARDQAREQLGPDCVILETVDSAEGRPASVTAMSERTPARRQENGSAPNAQAQDSPSAAGQASGTAGENDSPGPRSGGGNGSGTYGRSDLIPRSLRSAVEEGINVLSGSSGSNGASGAGTSNGHARSGGNNPAGGSQATAPQAGGAENDTAVAEPGPSSRRSAPANRGSGEVTMSRRSTPIHRKSKAPFDNHFNERAISQEVRALHRRFDHLESLMSETLISANLEYVSHPAFQQLLETGMRAPTVSRWFEEVLDRGIDPYDRQQDFLHELAGIVRGALDVEPAGPPAQHMLFVGPAGAGKTSLIMKLASDPDFMGNGRIALVSVRPTGDRRHYSPLPLFAEEQGIPHFEAAEGVEISKLVSRLSEFDHVFFDTPPISLHENDSFREFWRIRQLLTPVTPLEIHFTINATLERYYFTERYAKDHPVQPDFIAITHLDETDKWGHLLPFLQQRGCGVRYVSRGPGIDTGGIQHFSPSWFAEHILSHS